MIIEAYLSGMVTYTLMMTGYLILLIKGICSIKHASLEVSQMIIKLRHNPLPFTVTVILVLFITMGTSVIWPVNLYKMYRRKS